MGFPTVEFERPPIVELVLGVQFAPLTHFSSGHAGWFWKQYLGSEWDFAVDAPPIADQFESFDEPRRWQAAAFELRLRPGSSGGRLRIENRGRDRMIQVQPTRFHYNWKKKAGAYPSYRRVGEEFERSFQSFEKFVSEANLGSLVVNQWELTYIDRIPQGGLWKSVTDWHAVVPGLFPSAVALEGLEAETAGGGWSFEITPRRGRVHVEAVLAKSGNDSEVALQIQMTARGPIGKTGAPDWKTGLDLGHQSAVQLFLRLTSPAAHQHWGLKT